MSMWMWLLFFCVIDVVFFFLFFGDFSVVIFFIFFTFFMFCRVFVFFIFFSSGVVGVGRWLGEGGRKMFLSVLMIFFCCKELMSKGEVGVDWVAKGVSNEPSIVSLGCDPAVSFCVLRHDGCAAAEFEGVLSLWLCGRKCVKPGRVSQMESAQFLFSMVTAVAVAVFACVQGVVAVGEPKLSFWAGVSSPDAAFLSETAAAGDADDAGDASVSRVCLKRSGGSGGLGGRCWHARLRRLPRN